MIVVLWMYTNQRIMTCMHATQTNHTATSAHVPFIYTYIYVHKPTHKDTRTYTYIYVPC